MPEDIPPDAPRRWKRRLAVLAILAAGVGGFVALQVLKPRPAVRPPVKQLPIVRVAPVEVRDDVLTVTGHGLVRPRTEVTLAAELSGRVVELSPALVTGGRFGKGELLVRLDADPFRAALAQAVADRQSATAALALAEQQLERTRELIAREFLSRQTLDERIATRDQARAALARAEAVERQRRIDLDRTGIRAPFDGQVLSEQIDVGDTVQPGRELARIFDDDVLEVAVSLTDRDMALIDDPWRAGRGSEAPGPKAVVTVQHGNARYQWPAQLDRVEASVDSATRTFNVVVRVDEPQKRGTPLDGDAAAAPPLLVGMYAEARIAGRDQPRHALIPRRALRDGNTVWLLGGGDTVMVVPVRLLSEIEDRVAVSAEGIPDGARVVVSDLKVVTPGMAVRVAGEARPPGQGAP